ncbi:MAG TPA: carboxypeptidase regulatory-like domain-containing protein [Bryobacteraceae bacterium]|jgi:hypothetical protein|nr:carboxypeptidase regulatory-like domain-containing protein [Bryobacteraceae bacterium]
MSKRWTCTLCAALLGLAALLPGQAPTGVITGIVTDESGAVIPNATVTITNKATGVARAATTNSEGLYSAPALPAGDYSIKVEARGFKISVRDATLTVGGETQVNMPMSIGTAAETVTVEAATAQINYESHTVEGVIPRAEIQDLPLNGRSYLQLAGLEPGVTISSGTPAQFNAIFTVSVLGAGNRTVVTVDGGNVSDNIDVGGGMSSMNFSQEMVQEFQVSEVNFDLATPIAAGGAINMVTRSGSNDFHGSGYFFFRDHNMAAYPSLRRACDPLNAAPACFTQGPNSAAVNKLNNPFFARRNPGGSLGGPIKKDKLFFFFNYEYQNQVQALAIQSTDPAFSPILGTYGSPYVDKTISVRIDDHISAKHNLMFRYSHDGNAGFGQALEFGDPSNWARNTNWADQAMIGLTSTFTPTIVNDFRVQYNYWNNHNNQALPSDCSAPCVAGSLPNVFTFLGSNMPAVGPNFNAPQARNTRRYEFIESLSWQKGTHRFKFGGDLNPTNSAGLWGFCTPMCVGAFSPTYVRQTLLPVIGQAAFSALFPTLPLQLKSDADVLNLPVLNINSSIFSGIGVGNVTTPAAYDYSQARNLNQYRAYFQDVWKIRPNFTLNYGLAWNAQVGFYNNYVPRPQYLAPILGANNLGGTQNNTKEFQPAFGFAWSPFRDGKTVIRGGAGIYWDSTPGYYKLREMASIGPPGSARNTLAASAFTNPYPTGTIINFNTGQPIPQGAPLPLSALTNMTIGQFVNVVNQELPSVAAVLAPSNTPRSGPFPYPNINFAKQGVEIYPQNFPLARSYQTSIGIQRELPWGMVITADWARRQGENVSLGEVDQNLFARYLGTPVPAPVIPLCKSQPDFNPADECSTGTITFWTDEGRAVYDGLLVKAQKRLAHRLQFQVSYAFQKALSETVWDDAHWMAGYGEYLPHHNLNIAGTYNLPWGFSISMNSSIISRTPQTPTVPSLDLPGTVPAGNNEPLPGLAYGCLAASCGKDSLQAAVNAYNSSIVGTKNAQGAPITSSIILPQNYEFGDPTLTQDFRLTKVFTVKERYRFTILGEMFNAFNIANLSGYSFSLDTGKAGSVCQQGGQAGISCNFGQPTQRVNQTFGSAGPRAVQVGARFSF